MELDASVKGDLDPRYSEANVQPMALDEVRQMLADAPLYWLSTVRPDDRPHVTPLIGVWHDGTVCFCTGPEERKNQNLASNHECVVTTGTNALDRGTDVVVEGAATRIVDDAALRDLADAYLAKYGEDWRFNVAGGAFHHVMDGGEAYVYRVEPRTIFAFGKSPYSQTKWRFGG